MSRATVKYIAAGAVLLAAVGYLAYASMKGGWASYHVSVDEFVGNSKFQNQRVRLAGNVAAEGLVSNPGRTGAQFTLVGQTQHMPVVYKGVVPDMFKPGGEVVVEGRLDKDGVFRADVMMTKCASKYESDEHGHKPQKQEKPS